MRTGGRPSWVLRGWAQLGLWLLEFCAATATVWFIPYEPAVWRDWRTDVRLRHLDVEMRFLLDSPTELKR